MKRTHNHFLLLFILYTVAFVIFTSIPESWGQPAMSEEQWQQLMNDKAFYYKNEKEGLVKPREDSNALQTIVAFILAFFQSGFGRMLIWIFFFSLLSWALFKVFISDKTSIFGKAKKAFGDTADDEEELQEINWEQRLQSAINENNLRLAVRYSYMWLLQLLQEQELISYKSDKTNHDYYHELQDNQYKQPFRQLSRQYEYTWYGDFPITVQAYDEYMNTFNTLKNRLQP